MLANPKYMTTTMTGNSIKKILVPLDLSDASLNALVTAVSLAKQHKAILQILNVDESLPGIFNRTNSMKFTGNDNVFNALKESIERIKEIDSSLLQKKGNVVETIIDTAVAEKTDLIIIGKHGASGSRQGFMGTNAYNVVKFAPCAILTTNSKNKVASLKRVLFPIRALPGSLRRYLIARNFMVPGATLQILGLSDLKMERETEVLDKIVNEIKDVTEADQINVTTAWTKAGTGAHEIIQYAGQHRCELIAITSAFDPVSKGHYISPVKQQLLHFSDIPILYIQ
jgi:nucleotide-binding universal stress UspA family protein